MSYSLERISKKKYVDMIGIFKSAFNINVKLEKIQNKFNTPTGSVKNIGYLAYSNQGEPSGFYGVYPTRVLINGEIFLVSQSGDTMVKKEHVKGKLFSKLAHKTYELCLTENIKGVFGFPSISSYYGLRNRLKWEFNENIRNYVFYVITFPLSEICNRFQLLTRFYDIWSCFIVKLYPKGKYFKGSIIDNGQDGVIRDLDYWEYKLKSNRVNVIKIFGCDVIIKFEGKLGVGDINYNNLKDLKRVLLGLNLFCLISGINRINFYTSPNTKLDNDLNKIKKHKKGLPIGFKSFNDDLNLKNLKFSYFDMDTF